MPFDQQNIRSTQLTEIYTRAITPLNFIAAVTRLKLVRAFQDDFKMLDIERFNVASSQAWLRASFTDLQLDTTTRKSVAQLLIDYIVVLAPYLHNRGADAQAIIWSADGIAACSYLGTNAGEVLLIRAEAEFFLGLWDDAFSNVKRAINATRYKDHPIYARATLALGRFQLNRGEYAEALRTLKLAESLLQRHGDTKGVAVVRAERAAYHLNRRELDAALTLYLTLEDHDQLRSLGDEEILHTLPDHSLLMVGIIYRKKRQFGLSEKFLQQLISRGENVGDQGVVAAGSHHIAWLFLEKGEISLAKRYCGRAAQHYRRIFDLRGQSDALEQLGLIALAEGNRASAARHLRKSLVIRRQLGNQQGAASSLRRLTSVYLAQGRVTAAFHCLWQSLIIYNRIGALTIAQLTNILGKLWYWSRLSSKGPKNRKQT